MKFNKHLIKRKRNEIIAVLVFYVFLIVCFTIGTKLQISERIKMENELKAKRPDMEYIEEQFKTLDRPSADLSRQMADYIYFLEEKIKTK